MGGFEGKAGEQVGNRTTGKAPPAIGTRPLVPTPTTPTTPTTPVAPKAAVTASPRTGADDALLDSQAALRGPDSEIPALEGALLSTRMEAVKRGLLTQAAFDAGLALSKSMTLLQPAVAANAPVDGLQRELAANAARQLILALDREAGGEQNAHIVPSQGAGVNTSNPYTGENRLTIYGLLFQQEMKSNWRARLPDAIHESNWRDAFRMYRDMMGGLDQWISDQLRKSGAGTHDAALGDAQQQHAALRTGLEQIAGKQATRLPAVFHADAKTVAQERAAGRNVEAVPVNVYFWKDAKDGKVHLYDLTTPGRPQDQTIEGEPSAAAMQTFFEEVARYPAGSVHYRLPGGDAGVATTTGKTKWYEWIGYVGLAAALAGLALLTLGTSVPATVCFAAGAVAGGVSAGGHLVDSAQLGTATTASVVLDVAQVAASFASLGAISITIKAGSTAAALAGSRWFVPLVRGAAVADGVQLVALTDITFVELGKLQSGPGSPEDKQRAAAVLLTQLAITGGLAVLSVRGARNARELASQSLEMIESNGKPMLRVAGDPAAAPASEPKPIVAEPKPPEPVHSAVSAEPAAAAAAAPHEADAWVAALEASLDANELAKLAKIKARKTPQQLRDMLGSDLNAAKERVQAEVRVDQERAASRERSTKRRAELKRETAADMAADPAIQEVVDGTTAKNLRERIPMLRDRLLARFLHREAQRAHPRGEVISGGKIYEKLPEATLDEWKSNHPGEEPAGLIRRDDGVYKNRGEFDQMVIERQPEGKAKIVAREEVKTGGSDTNSDARGQLTEQAELLRDAAAGKRVLRIEAGGRDIVPELDLASDALSSKTTRGPEGKSFDQSLGITAIDLEGLCKELLAEALEKKKP